MEIHTLRFCTFFLQKLRICTIVGGSKGFANQTRSEGGSRRGKQGQFATRYFCKGPPWQNTLRGFMYRGAHAPLYMLYRSAHALLYRYMIWALTGPYHRDPAHLFANIFFWKENILSGKNPRTPLLSGLIILGRCPKPLCYSGGKPHYKWK